MSDLIVLVFEDEEGAYKMRDKPLQLQNDGAISLRDAAAVAEHLNSCATGSQAYAHY